MAPIDVGVGLWCMRATARAPVALPALYAQLVEDARLAEAAGLHSLWLSEHHFWYDGWCPAPLVAGALALGATARLHVGTGVFLLPLHDPARVAAAGLALEQFAPGRFELGVGLGYRDSEYDGLGVSRRTRGRRADAALDALASAFAAGGPRLWVGGIAEAALRRGTSRGMSLLLPSSMHLGQVRDVIAAAHDRAADAGAPLGRIGVQKYAWLTDGSSKERLAAVRRITASIREYAGA
jgi:alkanesulfonate monooxygenase SsuD/methylene tetrahydromethanopterin reductase-like flavin-dependent oxidoreductase (luciferase family)